MPLGHSNNLGHSDSVHRAFQNNSDSGIAQPVFFIAQERIFHCITSATSPHTTPHTNAHAPHPIAPPAIAPAPCPASLAKYFPILHPFMTFPTPILFK